MKITLFTRDNNNTYSEACDVATVEIKKNNQIFYLGCQWGEHNPTDSIEYLIVDIENEELDSYTWLKNLGYDIEAPSEF